MNRTYRRIGFLVSALVHLTAVATLMPIFGGGRQADVGETTVGIRLAMFQEIPASPVEAEAPPEETPAEPEPTPEPDPEPEPEPEPRA